MLKKRNLMVVMTGVFTSFFFWGGFEKGFGMFFYRALVGNLSG